MLIYPKEYFNNRRNNNRIFTKTQNKSINIRYG